MLHPDGRLELGSAELPQHPVRVMVTMLENSEEAALSRPGDYLDRLSEYEERLARGEIKWQ
ncbi:MAG TPA: hypothetical protein VFI31_00165 [Pirellulales bacterium]|nr:hypothetical protein [Pirellulales bacterium]